MNRLNVADKCTKCKVANELSWKEFHITLSDCFGPKVKLVVRGMLRSDEKSSGTAMRKFLPEFSVLTTKFSGRVCSAKTSQSHSWTAARLSLSLIAEELAHRKESNKEIMNFWIMSFGEDENQEESACAEGDYKCVKIEEIVYWQITISTNSSPHYGLPHTVHRETAKRAREPYRRPK